MARNGKQHGRALQAAPPAGPPAPGIVPSAPVGAAMQCKRMVVCACSHSALAHHGAKDDGYCLICGKEVCAAFAMAEVAA